MKNKPGLSFCLLCFLSLICSHCNCTKTPPNSEARPNFSISVQPNSPAGNTSEKTTVLEESVESEDKEDQEENVDPSTLIHDGMVKRAQQAGEAYESLARVLSDLQKNTPGLGGKKYDINTPDEKGQTPLHVAIDLGDEEILQALLALNTDVNKKIDCPTDPSRHGMAPLHLAIAKGKENIVKMLVDTEGIDLNSQNFAGDTPFHMVLTAGINQTTAPLIRYLADQEGIDLNIQNKMGDTPAHLVGRAENGYAVYKSFAHRFDHLVRNKKGEWPFYTVFSSQ
jgi:ankyrin repeat protein